MSRTEISGAQVKDKSITEEDINLSDIITHNVSIQKHGLCPKLPNDTSRFLRGDGVWANLPTSTIPLQLAVNTYFISPSFNNSEPYFSSLENLMQFLDNNPPSSYIGIVIYSGVYADNVDLRYPASIVALGRVQYIRDFLISCTNAFILGSFRFERMILSSNSTMIVKLDCESIAQLNVNGSDVDATVNAREIIEFSSDFGFTSIQARSIQYVGLNGFANCKLDVEYILQINIDGEAKITVIHSKVGNYGSISDSPITSNGGCSIKIEDCRVVGGDYAAITINGIEKLILSNTLLLSNSQLCIDASSNATVFIRGSCTINQPNSSNVILVNQVEDFILEPNSVIENW